MEAAWDCYSPLSGKPPCTHQTIMRVRTSPLQRPTRSGVFLQNLPHPDEITDWYLEVGGCCKNKTKQTTETKQNKINN